MKIDIENTFAACNFENRFLHTMQGPDNPKWRVSCSYRLGDWIEEQDPIEWNAVGPRHRAVYDISSKLMEKIIILSVLTTAQ